MIENEGMMGTEVKRKERRGRTSLCCLTKYSEVSAAPNACAYHKVGERKLGERGLSIIPFPSFGKMTAVGGEAFYSFGSCSTQGEENQPNPPIKRGA